MDLSDLLSSLSDEDMKQLQETASQLLGNMSQQQAEAPAGNTSAGGFADAFALDPKLIGGLSKYFGKMNEKDAKCDFLYALKPLLQPDRRSRVDEAVNILRVMKIMHMMKDGGLLG